MQQSLYFTVFRDDGMSSVVTISLNSVTRGSGAMSYKECTIYHMYYEKVKVQQFLRQCPIAFVLC